MNSFTWIDNTAFRHYTAFHQTRLDVNETTTKDTHARWKRKDSKCVTKIHQFLNKNIQRS